MAISEAPEDLESEEETETALPHQQEPAPLPPVQVPDRYEMDRCRLTVSITMLEGDGHTDGRQVLLGVRNDEDVPLITLVRATEIQALVPTLVTLLAQLEADLPERKEAMRATLEEIRSKQPSQPTTPPVQQAPVEKPPVQGTSPSPQPQGNRKAKHKRPEESSPVEQMTLF